MKAFCSKNLFNRVWVPTIILCAFFLMETHVNAQVVNDVAKKKISIGVGLIDDIWMKVPSGVKTRTIDQGVQLFGMYNIPFGKSNFGFSIGLGLTVHNAYGNFIVNSRADSTRLVRIPDTTNYKRSKLMLTYLELPVEFHLKTNSKVSVGLGFKVGMLVASGMKYVGNGNISTWDIKSDSPDKLKLKMGKIKNLEQFTYGPTLRVGYKWFNVTASYMLSPIFTSGGPKMYPLSVGFVLMPF